MRDFYFTYGYEPSFKETDGKAKRRRITWLARRRDLRHRGGDGECPVCDGYMSWCTSCDMWSRNCCEDYGTCACS